MNPQEPTSTSYGPVASSWPASSRKPAVFGENNFQNEIVWKGTFAHSSAVRYGPVHDVILFYTGSDGYTWNKQYQPYDQDYLDTFFDHTDPDGICATPCNRTALHASIRETALSIVSGEGGRTAATL